jgi:hypothetical protein
MECSILRWKIVLKNDENQQDCQHRFCLLLDLTDSSFTLHAVTIGVDFHWQRNEDQVFKKP